MRSLLLMISFFSYCAEKGVGESNFSVEQRLCRFQGLDVKLNTLNSSGIKHYRQKIVDLIHDLSRQSKDCAEKYFDNSIGQPKANLLLLLHGENVVGFSNSFEYKPSVGKHCSGTKMLVYLYIGRLMVLPQYCDKQIITETRFIAEHRKYARQINLNHLLFAITTAVKSKNPSLDEKFLEFGFKEVKDEELGLDCKEFESSGEEEGALTLWSKAL